MPDASVALPSEPEVVVSVNATFPVAVAGETAAVKFTLWPVVSVPVGVAVSTVVVSVWLAAALAVRDTAFEVLVA